RLAGPLDCSASQETSHPVLSFLVPARRTLGGDMSPDSSTYLVAHEVSYAYPRRGRGGLVPAVSGVSLAVPRGSFTGLLGPNGCGKTTLLKLMAGVLRPESGTVTLEGRVLADLPRRTAARHEIG